MKKWLLRHIFRHIPWYFPTQIQQNILWDSPRGSGIHPIWVRLKTCFISRDDDGGDDDDDDKHGGDDDDDYSKQLVQGSTVFR